MSADPRREPWVRRACRRTLRAAAALLAAGPGLELGAQPLPTPAFALQPLPGSGGWVVQAEVPTGWSLYAPDPAAVGLPLTARWIGSGDRPMGEAVLAGPPPIEEIGVGGTARVHRGQVRFTVTAPPVGAEQLELRWAICRADLCVPGVARLDADRGRRPVTRPAIRPPPPPKGRRR